MAHKIYKITTPSGVYWRSTRCEAEYRCKRARQEGDKPASWEAVNVPEDKFALIDWLNSHTAKESAE